MPSPDEILAKITHVQELVQTAAEASQEAARLCDEIGVEAQEAVEKHDASFLLTDVLLGLAPLVAKTLRDEEGGSWRAVLEDVGDMRDVAELAAKKGRRSEALLSAS